MDKHFHVTQYNIFMLSWTLYKVKADTGVYVALLSCNS